MQQHSFYIDIDENLIITDVAPAFCRVISELCVGSPLEHHFALQNPSLPIESRYLAMFDGQLLTLRPLGRSDMIFGGTFNSTEKGFSFIGYPQLTEMNQLSKMGLSLSDFVSHDPINFYVGTLQLKDSMYKELISLNKELERSKEQLEELVEQRTKELLQSEKMASLGTLAAGVAHEINNPMGYMLSNLESLQSYMQDVKNILEGLQHLPIEQRKSLEQVIGKTIDWQELEYISEDIEPLIQESLKGGKRVSKTVAGLKSFAHPSDTKQCRISLKEALELAISLTMNEIKHKGRLNFPTIENIYVRGNLTELSQVFVNLLVNASHALTDNGQIDVLVDSNNGHVNIYVTDNGHGIQQENLAKLFQPFFTTKDVGSGTGLGLAISHGIIENHGGKIDVSSRVGHGSTFTVMLPLDVM